MSKSFKQILEMKDSYEKLKLLERKLESKMSIKFGHWHDEAVKEYNRLKEKEDELREERKKRIARKYKVRKLGNGNVSITITLSDLNDIISSLYRSYQNKLVFRHKCKILKPILEAFLNDFKKNKKKI